MRLLLLAGILLVSNLLFAQTIISGKAIGLEEEIIRLYVYQDLLTNTLEPLAQDTIDENGNFRFNLSLDHVNMAQLRTEMMISELYIEPNITYQVFLNYDVTKPKSAVKPQYIIPKITCDSTVNLNQKLKELNAAYGDFIRKNHKTLLRGEAKSKIDTFKNQLQKKHDLLNNNYLNTSVTYLLAELDFTANYSKLKMYQRLFHELPVYYKNIDYMNFFQQFYGQYMKSCPVALRTPLFKAIITQKSRKKALQIMAKDTLLTHPQIRELALINLLIENYNQADWEKKSLRLVLREIETQSRFKKHKIMARNARKKLTKLAEDTYLPEFEFQSITEDPISFNSLKGKPYYLHFFALNQPNSQKPFGLFSKWQKDYGKHIEMVSVCVDGDSADLKKLANSNNYGWTFAHYGGNPQTIDNFELRTLPMFYLVDEYGRIVKSPTPAPGEGILELFNDMIRRNNPRNGHPFEEITD